MISKGKKSFGIKILGMSGILISMVSAGILVWMNIMYKEQLRLSITKNIVFSLYIILLVVLFSGIIFLKNWARLSIILFSWVKIAESIIRAVNYIITDLSKLKLLHTFEQISNIIIYALLIFFLSRESVKIQFQFRGHNT